MQVTEGIYLKFNYVPAPQSIYKDIYKLEPGTFITIPYQAVQTKTIKTDQFWNLASVISKGCQDPITEYNEGTLQTKAVLSEAVLDSKEEAPTATLQEPDT